MENLIGRTLGPYQILEFIDSGGMAMVYRGVHTALGREVAIKVLMPHLTNKQFIDRFHREAANAGQLQHPNLLHVYDVGQDGSLHYMVMDYAGGGSLENILETRRLSWRDISSISAQIADGLAALHNRGIVHRDLKPSNVLFTRDGIPLLADFGIALAMAATRLTSTGTSLGTPQYMSPEQARGAQVDHRSDIYSLGVMMYEMVSGVSPFEAETIPAMIHKQLNEPPPPFPAALQVPETLQSIIWRALIKEPERRWQSTAEMAAALRGQRKVAKVSRKVTAGRQTRGVPVGAFAVVVAALLLMGMTSMFIWVSRPSGPQIVEVIITTTPDPQAPNASPQTIVITATPEPTSTPTSTASPTATEPTQTAVTTNTPPATETKSPATATPSQTRGVTSSVTPSPSSATNTPQPTATARGTEEAAPAIVSQPGQTLITGFEPCGNWRRGNQTWGTFVCQGGQRRDGAGAGQLDYDFAPANNSNDFVVFLQSRAIPGTPLSLRMWVYGDGNGHFLNVWLKDSAGQTWQMPFGTINHTGWKEMVGSISVNQGWPWVSISGNDNGQVDYPISFEAIVLDGHPEQPSKRGTIYVDALTASSASAGPALIVTGPAATSTIPAATATLALIATPTESESEPSATPLVGATSTAAVVPTAELAPTLAPSPSPLPPTAAPAQDTVLVHDFESCAWRRGDQAWANLQCTGTQRQGGGLAGELTYDFSAASLNDDYVVFLQRRNIAGTPGSLRLFVYGDGSGHFLNLWIRDNAGQTWQVPLGTIGHTGWSAMVGAINPAQSWPWTHISGPNNNLVDYPITFEAIVLDAHPERPTRSGVIYVDTLTAQ